MIDRIVTLKNVKDLVDNRIKKINTILVGIIYSVDYSLNRYNIQPMLQYKDIKGEYNNRAILLRCPMSFTKTKDFYIRAPYQVGDVVIVGCSKESLDDALTSNTPLKNSKEGTMQFLEMNGIILGGAMTDSENTMSEDNTTDLLIQNRNNGDKIVLKKTGGVEITTTSNVIVNSQSATVNSSSVEVNSDGVNVNSPTTTFSGNVTIGGNMSCVGAVSGATVTNGNGIDIGTHVHEYISPSGPKKTEVGE